MRQPIFGAGLRGKSARVTAQRRLNLYSEVQPVEDKARIVFYGTAGLDLFKSFGDTPPRGGIAVGDLAYVVHRGTFYEVNNAGVSTSRGTLNTVSGRVDMAYNGTQILVVDGTNGYTYTISSATFAQVADPDFPNGARTCDWQDGYFLVEDGNEFAISALDNGTAWDSLERASAEANPDNIVRVMAIQGQAFLFGPETTEAWTNVGALDFPYQRVAGGVIPWGLAARWSAAKYQNSIAGLFQNSNGDVQVGILNGYAVQPISDPELESVLNKYTVKSDATGLAYMYSGHPFYQLNFPSEGKSWLYEGKSGLWSELQSGTGRHRAEIAFNFQNRILVLDYNTGDLYRFNPDTYSDNGATIYRELISSHIFSEDRFSIAKLWVDMETGVGLATGQGSAPQIMLQVSKDGGNTFGSEKWASIGAIGKYTTRAEFRRLGMSRDFVFKLRVSDPVKTAIIGEGWLSGE